MWTQELEEVGMEIRYCTECCSLCVPYKKSLDQTHVYYRCTNPGCGVEDTELIAKSSPWDINHPWRCKLCGALHMTTHQEYLGYKIPCRLCGEFYDPECRPQPGKFGIDHRSGKQTPPAVKAGVSTTRKQKQTSGSRARWTWFGVLVLVVVITLAVILLRSGIL
jgi:hypothetical protein